MVVGRFGEVEADSLELPVAVLTQVLVSDGPLEGLDPGLVEFLVGLAIPNVIASSRLLGNQSYIRKLCTALGTELNHGGATPLVHWSYRLVANSPRHQVRYCASCRDRPGWLERVDSIMRLLRRHWRQISQVADIPLLTCQSSLTRSTRIRAQSSPSHPCR